MANSSKNDEFLTIRLDDEDRRTYQQKKDASTQSTTSSAPSSSDSSKGGNGVWITLVALIALIACGGCYYLYTLLEAQKLAAQNAESRIAFLEQKLSATGEEIGESTVALQVKVTELTNKTNELWEQMDKLWASAWRRNQQEITALGERVGKVETASQRGLSDTNANVSGNTSNIAVVQGQLAGLADELLTLNIQLEQAINDKQSTENETRSLADKLSVLEQRNNALSGRINAIENEIREMATQMVSQSSSPGGTPSSTPISTGP